MIALINTYPWQTALAIAVIFLLTLAKVYPATLYLFRIKFNYVKGDTLMQFWKQPNILARIFFYSTKYAVRYIGNNRRWYTYPQMKRVTSKRMINFLFTQERTAYVDSRRRIVKKERS